MNRGNFSESLWLPLAIERLTAARSKADNSRPDQSSAAITPLSLYRDPLFPTAENPISTTVSERAFLAKLLKAGFPEPLNQVPWTESDKELLTALVRSGTKISTFLQNPEFRSRSESSIRSMIKQLGLSKQSTAVPWSKEEVSLLTKLHEQGLGIAVVKAEHRSSFPNRTTKALELQWFKLGFSDHEVKRWDHAADTLVLRYLFSGGALKGDPKGGRPAIFSPITSPKELALHEYFIARNLSQYAIQSMMSELGLKTKERAATWSEEEVQLARTMHQHGRPLKEICKALNQRGRQVGLESVRQKLWSEGVIIPKKRPKKLGEELPTGLAVKPSEKQGEEAPSENPTSAPTEAPTAGSPPAHDSPQGFDLGNVTERTGIEGNGVGENAMQEIGVRYENQN